MLVDGMRHRKRNTVRVVEGTKVRNKRPLVSTRVSLFQREFT